MSEAVQFLHIGDYKTGTTWLQRHVLGSDDRIYLVGEGHDDLESKLWAALETLTYTGDRDRNVYSVELSTGTWLKKKRLSHIDEKTQDEIGGAIENTHYLNGIRAIAERISWGGTLVLGPQVGAEVGDAKLLQKMYMKMLFYKLKTRLFPSHIDRMARRWELDGGDERFRFDYELDEKAVVLDLGGYDGQWASDIYGRYGCNVYVFKPVQAYAEKIKSRFARNIKIKVLPYALGGKKPQT